MPLPEYFGDFSEADSLAGEQHDQVVNEIGRFIDLLVAIAGCACKREFDCFFADFLSDAFVPLRNKLRGIAALGFVIDPLSNDLFERDKEIDV